MANNNYYKNKNKPKPKSKSPSQAQVLPSRKSKYSSADKAKYYIGVGYAAAQGGIMEWTGKDKNVRAGYEATMTEGYKVTKDKVSKLNPKPRAKK